MCLTFIVAFPLLDLVTADVLMVDDGKELLWKDVVFRIVKQLKRSCKYVPVFLVALFAAMRANRDGTWEHSDVVYLSWSQRIAKVAVLHWWIVGKLIWPTQLRMHYQIQARELDVSTNAESLLACTATVLVALGMSLYLLLIDILES